MFSSCRQCFFAHIALIVLFVDTSSTHKVCKMHSEANNLDYDMLEDLLAQSSKL